MSLTAVHVAAPAALFVPGTGRTLSVHTAGLAASLQPGEVRLFARGAQSPVKLRFPGARPVTPQGLEPQTARFHFLLSPDQRQWRRNVPSFARARYASLWPGIDAIFYLQGSDLEYDLVLRPGADPRRIRLRLEGAPTQLENGALNARLGTSILRHGKPSASQDGHHVPVDYVVLRNGDIGLKLGAYDHTRPLTIDPVITYSTFLSGGIAPSTHYYYGSDYITAIAVDPAGNAYVTGRTETGDFPTSEGAYQRSPSSCFLSKLDPSGTRLLYSTYFIGSCTAIAVDATGSAYVAGSDYELKFPLSPGAPYQGDPMRSNGFVAKFAPDGSRLQYATYVYGTPTSIAVDPAGYAYVGGSVGGIERFLATPGASQISVRGVSDAYVVKLNQSATAFVYSTLIGGTGGEWSPAIALDTSGNVYLAGNTDSTDFPVTPGAPQASLNTPPDADAFLAKLNPTGSALIYATYLGGPGPDEAKAVAVDPTGAAYIGGSTQSLAFPVTPGAVQPQHIFHPEYYSPDLEGFAAKINPAGNAWVYSTYLGGDAQDAVKGIVANASGQAFLVGSTSSRNFPVTPDALPMGGNIYDYNDAFVARLDAPGTSLLFSSHYAGNAPDEGNAIAIGPSNDIFIAGSTISSDMPITSGTYQPALQKNLNRGGFLARLAFGDVDLWPRKLRFDNLTPHSEPALLRLYASSAAGARTYQLGTASDAGWLGVADEMALTLRASPGGLPPGIYSGTASVNSPGVQVLPSLLQATMVISEFKASRDRLDLTPDSEPAQLSVTGGTGLYYTAAADVSWLRLDHPAGVTPSLLALSADTTGLTAGVYEGILRLTPKSAPGDTCTVRVTLVVP
ncbi:SBBP repeat-containing protein [Paludibaculum fermentans]|uniref:DUF7948 domain-containing protein n=1 Tax=Paludibaculum fermentans TaxID=1473598 RepID=UPI003EB6AA44